MGFTSRLFYTLDTSSKQSIEKKLSFLKWLQNVLHCTIIFDWKQNFNSSTHLFHYYVMATKIIPLYNSFIKISVCLVCGAGVHKSDGAGIYFAMPYSCSLIGKQWV